MMNRIRIGALLVTLTGLGAIGVSAWAAESHTIEQAMKSMEIGQFFSVEGVVSLKKGDGIYLLSDDSGKMPVVIPEFITRKQGAPDLYERIRVSGKFDTKKLDQDVKGMRVEYLERMGRDVGGRGAPAPDETIVPLPAPPAALVEESQNIEMTKPVLGDTLVRKMRAQRRAYETAKRDADEASGIYARAAFVAGKDGSVDPRVVAQLEAAEARVRDIQAGVPELLEEAREAGLDESLIQMFEGSMGMR